MTLQKLVGNKTPTRTTNLEKTFVNRIMPRTTLSCLKQKLQEASNALVMCVFLTVQLQEMIMSILASSYTGVDNK